MESHKPWKLPISIDAENISGEVIVKIHGWCNLDCTYCYVYNSPDQSWREKPRRMSREVMDMVAERIAEYLREHRLAALRVVIHGGEPLLAGIDNIAYLVRKCREAAPQDRVLLFVMQTNGTLLTAKILDTLLELRVGVGVSLDGDERGNAHRIKRGGGSSYSDVNRGLELLIQDEYKLLLSGVLGVLHLENDPVTTYDHLAQYGAPVDFLWPLKNWDDRPLGGADGQPKYGEWMAAVFDHAYTHGVRPPARVRLLEQIVLLVSAAVTGRPFPHELGTDLIGPWVMGAMVIDTDGTVEGHDALKSASEKEAFTGLNLHDHTLTHALVALLQMTEQRGIHTLPTPCEPCALKEVCGGGFYPTRYNKGSYNNRSVYCADLTYLIRHIYAWLKREVAKSHATA